jgi:hypothetical protein
MNFPSKDPTLPKVDNSYFTERSGVIAVERIVNQMQCIWRETPNKDLGIDGQIEHVDAEGNATGHLIAVQVKAGASYLTNEAQSIHIHPSSKHRHYWESFPLPVVIIVYDPLHDTAYWQDARRFLRSDQRAGPIKIPRHQVLNSMQKDLLFESCGALGLPLLVLKDVLVNLIDTRARSTCFPLSFFDIFANGITDMGRKLFFSMGLCLDIAQFKLAERHAQRGISIGQQEYDFIHRYVTFLISQALIVFDYSDYLIDFYDRQVVSTFLVPLTSRGRKVCDLARSLGSQGNPYELTEWSIEMRSDEIFFCRLEANHIVAGKLADIFKEGASSI